MRRVAPLAAALSLAAPASAVAAAGDGPYEPFPDDPESRAKEYIRQLNARRPPASPGATPKARATARTSAVQAQGDPQSTGAGRKRAAKEPAEPRPGTPFERAGVKPASDPSEPSAVPLLIAAALLGAGGLALALRRARPSS